MTLLQRLIEKAKQEDEYMSQIISWYVDIGIDLIPSDSTGYTIVPLYQNIGGGWQNEDEWKHERQWLLPYSKRVANILRTLREEDDKLESKGELIVDF